MHSALLLGIVMNWLALTGPLALWRFLLVLFSLFLSFDFPCPSLGVVVSLDPELHLCTVISMDGQRVLVSSEELFPLPSQPIRETAALAGMHEAAGESSAGAGDSGPASLDRTLSRGSAVSLEDDADGPPAAEQPINKEETLLNLIEHLLAATKDGVTTATESGKCTYALSLALHTLHELLISKSIISSEPLIAPPPAASDLVARLAAVPDALDALIAIARTELPREGMSGAKVCTIELDLIRTYARARVRPYTNVPTARVSRALSRISVANFIHDLRLHLVFARCAGCHLPVFGRCFVCAHGYELLCCCLWRFGVGEAD